MTYIRPHRPIRHGGAIDHAVARASGIILRTPSNRILVSLRSLAQDVHYPGAWQIPGGKVSPAESDRDGAVRETLEETGLHIDTRHMDLIGKWLIQPSGKPDTPAEPYWAVVWLVDWPDEELAVDPARVSDEEKRKRLSDWQLMPIDRLIEHPETCIPGLSSALQAMTVPPPAAPEPEPKPIEEEDSEDLEDLLIKALKPSAADLTGRRSLARSLHIAGVLLASLLVVLVATLVGIAVITVSSPKEQKRAPDVEFERGPGTSPTDYKPKPEKGP